MPVEGVKLTMEYFIDKRVFVTGRKSVLGLDNPFNLTAFTNSQISLMGVSCAQNGLNIQTALDPITGTQTNCTELGGTLLRGTTVTGGGYQFAFDTVDLDFTGDFWFTQYSETIAIRSAQNLLLRGDSTVKLITPSIVASTGTVGQILTLQSSAGPATGGTCEWADPSAAMLQNIYTSDGTVTTNRSIGGDGELYSITFEEFSTFQVSDTNDITLSSLNNLTLSADNAILVKTPNVVSSSIGDVLTVVVAGTGECEWQAPIKTVSTAINYIANNREVVLVTTGATDKDITLPLAARANQQITIKKIDAGAGVVHILGNGVETIDGINDQPLNSQYEVITVVSNGTEWFVTSYN